MGRYSQRFGPAANFEVTAGMNTIPGMTITRHFGAGPVLSLWWYEVSNSTGFDTTHHTRILRNGAWIGIRNIRTTTLNTDTQTVHGSHLWAPLPGLVTFELQVQGSGVAGDTILDHNALLTLIELPLWDGADDFITL